MNCATPPCAPTLKRRRRPGRCAWGRLAVYYRKGLKQRAVPLADIASAELRAQSCRTKCCCGRMELEQLHLVLSGAQGELADVYSEDRRAMDSALAALRAALGEGAVSVQD